MLLNLKKHLTSLMLEGLITLRADIDISAGMEWEKKIQGYLNTAQIILLLISADFLASDYCTSVELKIALDRHERGEACVIPIIFRSCDWQHLKIGKLQALPGKVGPIASKKWDSPDDAYDAVVKGIRDVIANFKFTPETQEESAIIQEKYINKRIGEYVLVQEIGEGAHGRVYWGVHHAISGISQ